MVKNTIITHTSPGVYTKITDIEYDRNKELAEKRPNRDENYVSDTPPTRPTAIFFGGFDEKLTTFDESLLAYMRRKNTYTKKAEVRFDDRGFNLTKEYHSIVILAPHGLVDKIIDDFGDDEEVSEIFNTEENVVDIVLEHAIIGYDAYIMWTEAPSCTGYNIFLKD